MAQGGAAREAGDRYISFSREDWSRLRAATPLTLGEDDLDEVQGRTERLSLSEVVDTYLPLSRLLNLYVAGAQQLHALTDTFLGTLRGQVPYVIGIAGSVAVGKSTTARVLQALLARWPDHPRVDLVTTDGFLFPNAVLAEKGLMERKGFPESYDVRRLLEFLSEVKAGVPEVSAPVYSHLRYDIVPDDRQVVRAPDIVIVEGLNVLQTGGSTNLFVSDFFDFSIYVDADEADIESWFVERFLRLRETVFTDRSSYFQRYAITSDAEALEFAVAVWRTINGRNLSENILPTRERADLILEKGADHAVRRVHLRKH